MKNKIKFLDSIKRFILKKKHKTVKRNLQYHNLETAHSINLLFYLTDENYFKKVKEYFDKFNTEGKEINALGLVKNREDIGNKYLFRKGLDFFTQDDISFFGKINNSAISEFIEKKSDILINLTLEENFFVEHIFAMSKSGFKVSGLKNCEHADFTIDISKNLNIDFFIQQIDNYLKNIKKA